MLNKNMVYFFCFLAVAALWFFGSCKSNKDKGSPDTTKSDKLRNGFALKKITIWFYDIALENVDPNTFEILDDYFFKDKEHVYFYETYRVSQDYFTTKRKSVLPLKNADPTSFVVLGEGYAKDKSSAWFLESVFIADDLESLTVLNHHFIKDNKTAYVDRKPIAESRGISFELLSDNYAKDANKYYYCMPFDGQYEIKTIACHYETFVVIDHQYAKDKSSIFYEGEKLAEAESGTFELISSGYAKDIHHVYFRNLKVEKADPSTFSTFIENENSLGETVYAKDMNGIYVNDKHFAKADLKTFKILNEKYTLDKNGVYFKMKKVKKADPASFIVFPHFIGDADAEDKNHRYGEGKVVE